MDPVAGESANTPSKYCFKEFLALENHKFSTALLMMSFLVNTEKLIRLSTGCDSFSTKARTYKCKSGMQLVAKVISQATNE